MDFETEINKLKFQLGILGQTIDFEKHAVASLVFEFDWNEEQLDAVYDCFEIADGMINEGSGGLLKEGKLSHIAFEEMFRTKVPIGYQGLKAIVLSFYREDRYISVCTEYVKSHGDVVPVEYHRIQKDIQEMESR